MYAHVFETPAGFCGLLWEAAGVAGLCLPERHADAAAVAIRRRNRAAPAGLLADPPADIRALVGAIGRYFDGERQDFSAVPLVLRAREPFFGRVYAAVRGLGWGETTTYGALAASLGAGPEAAREVGRALGANPVPLLVPCHRVLAAGNRLGGFSAPGGAETKRRMLALEGVAVGATAAQAAFSF
ncbi:MAG: methylated-DNA--[protein]-cysteine S-methyltransferase [Amaricoccus sp.]|uniref:methylated-DNA--[protein]-cysteine S-methyltransferase n=1 Tax=Amaricoccus sp. TaxID=1872485 RepID=UPI0039E68179